MKTKFFLKTVNMLFLSMLFAVIFNAATSYAADRYWLGDYTNCSNNYWINSSCWTDVRGKITPGGGVPTASDDAYFTDDDITNCFITSQITVRSITMETGYTGTVDQRIPSFGKLTVNNDLSIEGGKFKMDREVGGVQQLDIISGSLKIDGGEFDGEPDKDGNSIWSQNTSDYAINFLSGTFRAPRGGIILENGGGWYQASGTTLVEDQINGVIELWGGSSKIQNDSDNRFSYLYIIKDNTSDTLQIINDLKVKDIEIATGTLTHGGSSGDIYVSGYWDMTNWGDYDNSSERTVYFDGTGNQTIYGSTSFHNLTKNVTTAATLYFGAGKTQTIAGTLNLQGSPGQLLSIRSTTTDTQASIDPQGSRMISYLDVKDNNNTNATIINAGSSSVDSGNNTNWSFTDAAIIPEFRFYMYLLSLLGGFAMIWYFQKRAYSRI